MTQAVIVLEGPDGAGKTTLLNDPTFFKGISTLHLGPPSPEVTPLFEYVDAISQTEGHSVKFDRLHLGERIYGQIFRHQDRLGVIGQRMVERVLLGRHAVCIKCMPPYPTALHNWKMRRAQQGELIQDELVYRDIYNAYDNISSDLPTKVYDYTDPYQSTAELSRWVMRHVKDKPLGPGSGALVPGTILLVGDQVNSKVSPWSYPFVADSGCSVWLTEQLEQAGIREASLYWVNATAVDGTAAVPGDWLDYLSPTLTVAMGLEAYRWARNFGSGPITKVHHPQYWKRFKGKQRYPLLDVLTEPLASALVELA